LNPTGGIIPSAITTSIQQGDSLGKAGRQHVQAKEEQKDFFHCQFVLVT
jgi:hypothetical protein